MDDALRRSFIRAIGIALMAGLGAIPTALLLILALVVGQRLDTAFGTSPVILLALLCLGVPLSIFAMLRIALFAANFAARLNREDHQVLQSGQSHPTSGEEDHS